MIQMICAFDPDLRILIVSKHELEQNAVCNYFIYKSLCNVELTNLGGIDPEKLYRDTLSTQESFPPVSPE